MNPEYIIHTIAQTSAIHYRDGDRADRLAYQVGMLEAKIREICIFHDAKMEFFQKEMRELSKLIDNLS